MGSGPVPAHRMYYSIDTGTYIIGTYIIGTNIIGTYIIATYILNQAGYTVHLIHINIYSN